MSPSHSQRTCGSSTAAVLGIGDWGINAHNEALPASITESGPDTPRAGAGAPLRALETPPSPTGMSGGSVEPTSCAKPREPVYVTVAFILSFQSDGSLFLGCLLRAIHCSLIRGGGVRASRQEIATLR